MKKQRTSALAFALIGVLGLSALAVGGKSILADLRPDVTIRIDGVAQTMTDAKGDPVYPIVYEGTTYLPIRAIGNLVDYAVNWDGTTQTVSLDRKTASGTTTVEQAAGTGKTYDGYVSAIKDFSDRGDVLVKEGDGIQGAAKDWQTYRNLLDRIQKLEREMDAMDNALERDYRAGTLPAAQYWELDRLLDQAENKMDDLDDRVENQMERWYGDRD